MFEKVIQKIKRSVGLATAIPSGSGMLIPRSGTGGGGEYGSEITDDLRTFAITREPVAYRVVFTVAHDIFDNWFTLKLEGDEKGEESKLFDKQIQNELTRLHAKEELSRMSVFERAYGWAIIVLGYEDSTESLAEPVKGNKALREIKAYGPTQVMRVDEVKDTSDPRYGLPKIYNIKQSGIASYLKVHHSRVIHFSTRLINHDWKGRSVLDPVWDDLTTLRNIRWGMGQTMYRYGSGFPDITFNNAEQEDIQAWVDAGGLDNWNSRTGFVHNEDQIFEFKGPEGHALNPMNFYLPIMENISCGSGIPLAILRGVQAGALTGSEVNQQEYYGLISDEQSAYETGIRELINIVQSLKKSDKTTATDQQAETRDFKFEWQGGFELDEKKKAEIEQLEMQALQIKANFLTRNEIRALIDPNLKDLSKEQGGEEVLGKSGFGNEQFDYHVREIPKNRPSNARA